MSQRGYAEPAYNFQGYWSVAANRSVTTGARECLPGSRFLKATCRAERSEARCRACSER